ncbi:epimerase [Cnuibacter physcomitrellae]|uniref:Uncharacterized protein n=1 Tax=Cnuibacter physcomitrellae TaxID=1619308 RepID=A0A1X9LP58_9MICO|nr:sugar phosphate isomerase/epimerase [Cnuibacter physcomitrellae]ARJ06907.1 hypothetical protein B5808_18000 [Cnuibacter physcomitrellae]GGI39104.1 epimerase [Cnuibacter physcomitrellae]
MSEPRIPFRLAAARRVRPLGAHAGIWMAGYSTEAFARAADGCAGAGFDLLELPSSPEALADASSIARGLDRRGLDRVVSLALDTASDVSSADEGVRAEGERRLTEAVRLAEEVGAPYVGGVTFSAMTKFTEADDGSGRQRSLEVLRRVASRAVEADVRIGVEYVNRYESNLLNTAADTRRFLEELDLPTALLHIDTYHANVEETSQAQAVADAGDRLAYIHAAENHRGELGTGSIDWAGFARALVLAGYRGPLTFESFTPAVTGARTAAEIGLWRSLWSDPDAVAASAARFLRLQLDLAEAAVGAASDPARVTTASDLAA